MKTEQRRAIIIIRDYLYIQAGPNSISQVHDSPAKRQQQRHFIHTGSQTLVSVFNLRLQERAADSIGDLLRLNTNRAMGVAKLPWPTCVCLSETIALPLYPKHRNHTSHGHQSEAAYGSMMPRPGPASPAPRPCWSAKA
jgi:hypothetical protein